MLFHHPCYARCDESCKHHLIINTMQHFVGVTSEPGESRRCGKERARWSTRSGEKRSKTTQVPERTEACSDPRGPATALHGLPAIPCALCCCLTRNLVLLRGKSPGGVF
eukprot:327097-Rhodomonas_salina.3